MALADAFGNLTDFRLLAGQAHGLRGTAALIDGLTCGQFLADLGVRCQLGPRGPGKGPG